MSQNIENLDNRPWVPHHIPNAIRKELYRRTLDQGLNYVDSLSGWYDDQSKWKKYRGPLSAWTRVTSNGTGFNKLNVKSTADFLKNKRDGFVMYGGQGFYDAFGKINLKDNNTPYTTNILGYDVFGSPHILDLDIKTPHFATLSGNKNRNVPIFMPPPGIVSIEANMQKERIRKVVINWKCYSFAQLEYLTPYFLTPGISMIVEFGWNLFNINSLINLTDESELTSLFKDGTPLYNKILDSNGMYDVTFGIVSNFEFGTQDGIKYDCKTEIYSKHRNHTGALMNEAPQNTIELNLNGTIKEITTKPSLYEFCSQRLKNVTKCLEGQGKNFFEALTPEEEKKFKSGFENKELIKNFFNGNPENRIFMARNKIQSDPVASYGEPDKEIDWDSGSPDDTWVTMGFVIELINLFIGQKISTLRASDNPNYELFTFNIDDVIIGAHPNLLSVDGNKVLIPNPMAPKFNLGSSFWKSDYPNGDYVKNTLQSQTSYNTAASFEKAGPNMLPYNSKLYHVFKTGYGIDTLPGGGTTTTSDVFFGRNTATGTTTSLASLLGAYRNNLDWFINRFRYNYGKDGLDAYDAAFPQIRDYTDKGNNFKAGYWGYLKDIYVNVNVITETAKISKTAEDFLSTLLNILSGTVAGFWELAIVEDEDKLKIIDKKFISKKIYQNLFQFDISSDTCIKELNFTVIPSNAQMTQVIAGSNNNQGQKTGQVTATSLPDFYFGDRLGINQIEQEKQKSLINESSDLIKQLQKYGKVPDAFFVSLKGSDIKKYYEVLNLALPSKHLLLTLLNSEDYEDNLNIYGGQQPNFTCELTLQGISGLRTFQCFSIKNLPKPYSPDDVIFSIIDITHSIQNGDWVTVIKAGIRPISKVKTSTSNNYEFTNGHDAFESTTNIKLNNLK
jgi:hypothetical protein